MKQILDFLPILLFFGAFKMYDIYAATGVLMVATTVPMLIMYKLDGRLTTMHKVTWALVLGFGALTLGFHDERFVKIKPTVLYAFTGLTLAIGLWVLKKNFLKMMLGTQLKMPDGIWRNLTVIWVSYSFFMASLNAYVALMFTTEQWVNFKLWGYAFPLIFLVGQGIYIAKHLQSDEQEVSS